MNNYLDQNYSLPAFQYGNGGGFDSINSYAAAGGASPQGYSIFGTPGMGDYGQGFQLPGIGTAPSSTTGIGTLAGSQAGTSGIFGGLGMNIPTMQLGLGGLMALGNLYGAFQSNRLAKDNFNFTKDTTNTNLNNQIKSYNTTLEDRARSRAVQEGRDQTSADQYIQQHRLTR